MQYASENQREQRKEIFLQNVRKITSPDIVIFENAQDNQLTTTTNKSYSYLRYLSFEQREKEIHRLTLEHYCKEIQCGHIKDGKRTTEYQHHQLNEVNDRLLGICSRPFI
jgi:uncharacterized protein YlbG (UPF0298 family)